MSRILTKLWEFLKDALWGIWGFNYPCHCLVCDNKLYLGEMCICRPCLDELPSTYFERSPYDNMMVDKMVGRVPHLESAFACFYFRQGEHLRKLIHEFKYQGFFQVAKELGREMGRKMCYADIVANYDYLIPVPLHPKKLRTRGYNQSLMIAEGVRQVTGIPILEKALLRTVYAGSQTKLSADQRYKNVKSDFGLGPEAEMLKGKSILLIDDVFTTGATSESCLLPLSTIEGIRLGIATVAMAKN